MASPAAERLVLLVEDDRNDVLMMGRAFSRADLDGALSVATDGEEAVRLLESALNGGDAQVPSLVLLDLKLPKKGGLEVLSWIRAQKALRHVPVIILTSSQVDRDLEQAYALGANSYLVKPVGFDQLLEVVKSLKAFWLELNQSPNGSSKRKNVSREDHHD